MSPAIRGYERLAESLCSETAVLNHGFWSGLAPAGSAASAFRRNRRLFSDRAIATLREAATSGEEESERRRRARQLLAFALESRVLAARLPEDARAAEAEARALVRADGRSVPLTRIRGALVAEPDAARRRPLLAAADELVAERLDPLLSRARDREIETLAAAGFGSRSEAILESEGIDLAGLAAAASRFVEASEGEYTELLEARTRELGLDAADLDAADLPALVEAGAASAPLGAAELRASYESSLAGLGLDPQAGGRITLDLEPRPGKSERSFCTPAVVPGDVRIVIGCDERGGARSTALLHEAGHALHRAHTDPDLDVPARLLGDSSVTESYAFLFEGLATGASDDFASLLLVRRYCAVLIAELELERRWGAIEPAEGRERFGRAIATATGVPSSGARWLRAPDPGFYAARYLRGWMLAELWRRELCARFGEGWAGEPEAGAWLSGLWADGQRRDALRLAVEETASGTASGGLGFEALARV